MSDDEQNYAPTRPGINHKKKKRRQPMDLYASGKDDIRKNFFFGGILVVHS